MTVAGSVVSPSGSPSDSSTKPAPLGSVGSFTSRAIRATHADGKVGPLVTSAWKWPTSTGPPGPGTASAMMETS
jgi:hypothetical protein